MIWLSLLIPLITIIVLIVFYSKRIHWLEYIVLFTVPLLCIIGGKFCSVQSQIKDTEYWDSHTVISSYYEAWNERVSCRHPKYETRTRTVRYTDSNGRSHSRMETYQVRVGNMHMYDVDYHPENWNKQDNIGNRYSISKSEFEYLCTLWTNRVFKDMHRKYHTIDGNAYYTTYDKVFDHTQPICITRSYENKIQCSKSVFNFQEVDKATKDYYQLYDYTDKPTYGVPYDYVNTRLAQYNGLNGSKRQLHMILCVYTNKPLEAGMFQESYWKGGNKNEFIVCVGVNNTNITWTKVISWTEVEDLKVRTAREIKEMGGYNPVKIVDYMGNNIPKTFIRKEFKDFNYISVEPTTSAVIWTFVITLLVTLGIAIFSIKNDIYVDFKFGK